MRSWNERQCIYGRQYIYFAEKQCEGTATLVMVKVGLPLKVKKYISIQGYCTGDYINKNPNTAFLIHTYSYI